MDRKARFSSFRLFRPRLGAVIAIAVASGFIAWLATRSNGDPSTQASPPPPPAVTTSSSTTGNPLGPVALSASALRAVAGSLGRPVYWGGPQPGRRYELQRTTNGDVFLRYLPAGVKAGDKRALLTVGTYPFKDAYTATKALTKESGTVYFPLPDGGFAFFRRKDPTNIYVVYPKLDYQIEVFSPSPSDARRLVVSGRVRLLQ